MSRRIERNEQGFFTIWTLGLCVMLMAMGGVSLDLWRGFTERRELAALTDSAAIAAASQIDLEAFKTDGTAKLDPVLARQVALNYLEQEAAVAQIEFLNPPVVEVNGELITVEASTRIELTLMKLFQPGGKLDIVTHSAATPEAVD